MSDQQKIWFIYLTDHHEGPFTASEIAEKAKAGLVNGQSLAWKDGMPEWVAAETIPELAQAMAANATAVAGAPAADAGSGLSVSGGTGSTAAPETAAAPTQEGEVSLAQLLAQSQKGGEASPAVEESAVGQIADSASVLSSMVSSVQSQNPVTSGTGLSIGAGVSAPTGGASGPEPGPDEEVWTLKIGTQVSGLHSLKKLKDLAGSGEIPADAMLWHPGWSDFQPTSAVPQIESARKGKAGSVKASGTRTSLTRPGMAISAMSNAAAAGDDDEPTDTGLTAPPKGFKGLLFKVHTLVEKLKRKKKSPAKTKEQTKETLALGKGKAAVGVGAKKAGGQGGGAKRVAGMIGGLVVVLGILGGGYWWLMLRSPLPSGLDVSEDDKEIMAEAIKQKPDQGHKLVLAVATGNAEDPPDPALPKFYVASNLPEGTSITMNVVGVPKTLVNRTSFEKSLSAAVEKTHLATFDGIKDENGKPLWGEFMVKVTAEGAEAAEMKKFIGISGARYKDRLKQFTESVQGEYDKEIAELREYITTIKNLQVEASKQIADYKKDWAIPANRTKITADWSNFTKNSSTLLSQLETNLKARLSGDKQPKYHARSYQDVSTTVGQLTQLAKVHGERLSGATPSGNADELEGLVQAGVISLEGLLAQAVSKTPFDSSSKPQEGNKAPAPPPSGTPAPPAAPGASAPAAPAAPTPAAGAAPAGPSTPAASAAATAAPAAPASPSAPAAGATPAAPAPAPAPAAGASP